MFLSENEKSLQCKHYNYRIIRTILAALLLSLASCSLFAQDVSVQKQRTPDGVLGRLSLNLSTSYMTVKTDEPLQQYDISRHRLITSLPVSNRLTLQSHLEVRTADSTSFNVGGGVRFRPRNPIGNVTAVNPDGAIGAPVISLMMLTHFSDHPDTEFESIFIGSLLLPISCHFSVEVGYSNFERELIDDIDGIAVSFSWYPKSYRSGYIYSNPDGVAGTPSIHLTGAGSSDRKKVSIRFDLPINTRVTPYVQTSYMETDDPAWTGFSARIGISFYSFN